MARNQNESEQAAVFYLGALAHDPGNALLLEQAFLMEAMDGASPAANQLAEQLSELIVSFTNSFLPNQSENGKENPILGRFHTGPGISFTKLSILLGKNV